MATGSVAPLLPALGEGSWRTLWLPENISTYGQEIDDLFILIFVITGILFVVTEVLLFAWSFWYRARKAGDKAHFIHGHHKLEACWTTATAAVLLFIAFWQWGTWKHVKIDMPPEGEAEGVRVFARQFQWYFWHDRKTADIKDDVIVDGVLHVPVGKKVLLHMRSKDVLHSLFIPHARFKQDLVPGLTVRGWFEVDENKQATTVEMQEKRGDPEFYFDIACAELCGYNHGEMRARMVVHPAKSEAPEVSAILASDAAFDEAVQGHKARWAKRWGADLAKLTPEQRARLAALEGAWQAVKTRRAELALRAGELTSWLYEDYALAAQLRYGCEDLENERFPFDAWIEYKSANPQNSPAATEPAQLWDKVHETETRTTVPTKTVEH